MPAPPKHITANHHLFNNNTGKPSKKINNPTAKKIMVHGLLSSWIFFNIGTYFLQEASKLTNKEFRTFIKPFDV